MKPIGELILCQKTCMSNAFTKFENRYGLTKSRLIVIKGRFNLTEDIINARSKCERMIGDTVIWGRPPEKQNTL